MSGLVVPQLPTPACRLKRCVKGVGELTAVGVCVGGGTLLSSLGWLGTLLGPDDENPYGKMLRASPCQVFNWPIFFLVTFEPRDARNRKMKY